MEGKLPENWVNGKLYEIMKPVPTNVKEFVGEKKYFSTGSVSQKKIEAEGIFTYNTRPSRANREVEVNDVLQARMKNTNKAFWVTEEYKNDLFSTGFMQLRSYGKTVNSKYVFYYLNSLFFLKQKDELATGATQQAINDGNAAKLDFPLPPLAEQERIVTKLDALFAQQEVMKKALSRIPALLKDFRQQVLTQAVTGKLTASWREGKELESGFELLLKVNKEKQNLNFKSRKNKFEELFVNADLIPKKWAFGSPDEICSPEKYSLAIGPFGSNLKVEDYTENGVPLIFIRNIKANKFSGLSEKFVSLRKAKELEAHSIEGNDLIIAKMGDPPGDCELYPSDSPKAIITADCLKFRIWDKYFDRFFYKYIINSGLIKEQLASMTFGVAQQKISLDRFKSLKLPVPPFEEQIEIVMRIESLISKADAIEIRYKKLKEKIDTLPQAILNKTFKGELVAQLPTDGDAKDLLKEILDLQNTRIKNSKSKIAKSIVSKNSERKKLEILKLEVKKILRLKAGGLSYSELRNEDSLNPYGKLIDEVIQDLLDNKIITQTYNTDLKQMLIKIL